MKAAWTPQEDQILLTAYAEGGFRAVEKALPKIALSTCRQRYYALIMERRAAEAKPVVAQGPISSDPWTQDEDRLFIQAHGAGGLHAVYKAFPHRSRVACDRRLQRLRSFGVIAPAKKSVDPVPSPTAKQALPPHDPAFDRQAPYLASALDRMATQMGSIAPFDIRLKGLTQYVQQPEFGEKYEFIRRRMLWEMDRMASQLALPPEVVYRAVQVLGSFDFAPGNSLRPPVRSHDRENAEGS